MYFVDLFSWPTPKVWMIVDDTKAPSNNYNFWLGATSLYSKYLNRWILTPPTDLIFCYSSKEVLVQSTLTPCFQGSEALGNADFPVRGEMDSFERREGAQLTFQIKANIVAGNLTK